MEESSKLQKANGQADVTVLLDPAEQNHLIALFEGIASEECWQPGEALRRYRERSVYLVASLNGQMQGGAQLVLPDGEEGLPGREVWPEVNQMSAEPSAHVAVLALLLEARGHRSLFRRLCVELWCQCQTRGIETLWLEATPATLRVYRRMGWPLEIVGELRMHWGEECFLCRMGVEEVSKSLRRKAACSEVCREMVYLADCNSLPDA